MGAVGQGRSDNWRMNRLMNRSEGFCCGGSLPRALGPTALCLCAVSYSIGYLGNVRRGETI